MKLLLTLEILRDVSWLFYIGPMLAFTLCLHFSCKTEAILTAFQAWGIGFGLSLGASIFFALSLYYLHNQNFYLRFDQQALFSSGVLVGLILWISNLKLEVWTLDPIRKITEAGEQRDKAIRSLKRHLLVHSALIIATDLLCRIGERTHIP